MIFLSATSTPGRPSKLEQFYRKLGVLHEETDGPYYLSEGDGNLNWPTRGIYVFFSPDTDLDIDPVEDWHIVRIGTVGDCAGSTSSLWDRLRAHRGTQKGAYAGGGNHRGSIFRKHVGRSIIEQEGLHDEYPHWGTAHRNLPEDLDTTDLREQEDPLEQRVSDYIRNLPFLVIDIPGEPGPDCERAMIEKNLIALVAHARRTNPSLKQDGWLGHSSPHAEIAKTGLWNIHHVNAFYSGDIINQLDPFIERTEPVGLPDS